MGVFAPFFATTASCANPIASRQLRFVGSLVSLCRLDHPRLVKGPSRRYTCESFTGCLVPYPGGSKGALSRFFPLDFGLALSLQQVGALQCSAQRLQRGEGFRGCRHFVMLRPPVLLATQVAPTATVNFRCCPCCCLRKRVTIFALWIAKWVHSSSIAPSSSSPSPQGSRGVYIRAEYGSLPPHTSGMLVARIGQLATGDFHPLDSQLVGCSVNRPS